MGGGGGDGAPSPTHSLPGPHTAALTRPPGTHPPAPQMGHYPEPPNGRLSPGPAWLLLPLPARPAAPQPRSPRLDAEPSTARGPSPGRAGSEGPGLPWPGLTAASATGAGSGRGDAGLWGLPARLIEARPGGRLPTAHGPPRAPPCARRLHNTRAPKLSTPPAPGLFRAPRGGGDLEGEGVPPAASRVTSSSFLIPETQFAPTHPPAS